jgi:hypothetical protein
VALIFSTRGIDLTKEAARSSQGASERITTAQMYHRARAFYLPERQKPIMPEYLAASPALTDGLRK